MNTKMRDTLIFLAAFAAAFLIIGILLAQETPESQEDLIERSGLLPATETSLTPEDRVTVDAIQDAIENPLGLALHDLAMTFRVLDTDTKKALKMDERAMVFVLDNLLKERDEGVLAGSLAKAHRIALHDYLFAVAHQLYSPYTEE